MYIVIEIQTNGENTATIVNVYASRAQAESQYHTILAAAALSNVQIHAATMLTAEGMELMHQAYIHQQAEE